MSRADLTDADVMEMAKSAADTQWRDAVTAARVASSVLPSKLCRKCGGSGDIQHMTHVEWGKCFGCNGLGRIIVKCDALRVIERQLAAANVERLRVLYRGHQMALSMLAGGMTECPEWAVDSEIDSHRANLEQIGREGQEAARHLAA